VLLAATSIGIECFVTGFAVPMKKRMEVFNKEFMEKNFKEMHEREIGSDLPQGGYPDMGNGRYAEKLTYKQWYELNNA